MRLLVFCATGLIVLSLVPAAANLDRHGVTVLVPGMVILALLGVGIGIAVTRLARRRPSDGPADDYDDPPR